MEAGNFNIVQGFPGFPLNPKKPETGTWTSEEGVQSLLAVQSDHGGFKVYYNRFYHVDRTDNLSCCYAVTNAGLCSFCVLTCLPEYCI